MFQEPPGTWRSHIYSVYYGGGHIADLHRRTRLYPRVFLRRARVDHCVRAYMCGCVGRQGPWGAGASELPAHHECLPVSHFLIKPIQPGSRLLGFCLCIGCSLEYLPRQAKNSVRESCFQMFTRAASMRMSVGACSRRLESEMGICAKTKVIDLIFEIIFSPFLFIFLLIQLCCYFRIVFNLIMRFLRKSRRTFFIRVIFLF